MDREINNFIAKAHRTIQKAREKMSIQDREIADREAEKILSRRPTSSPQEESTPKKYAYDNACLNLAEHFLSGYYSKEEFQDLAQHIQDAVEDWFAGRKS